MAQIKHAKYGDVDLDYVPEIAASRLEDVLEALAARRRLVRDAALDQVACGICRDLTRDKNVRASLDGLGLSSGHPWHVSKRSRANWRPTGVSS